MSAANRITTKIENEMIQGQPHTLESPGQSIGNRVSREATIPRVVIVGAGFSTPNV